MKYNNITNDDASFEGTALLNGRRICWMASVLCLRSLLKNVLRPGLLHTEGAPRGLLHAGALRGEGGSQLFLYANLRSLLMVLLAFKGYHNLQPNR